MSDAADTVLNSTQRESLNGIYFAGALMRVAFVACLILGGFTLLEFLRLAVDSRRGIPITVEEISIVHLLYISSPLLVPVLVTLLISECQIIVLRIVGFSANVCLILVPLSLAVLGGLLAVIALVDDPPVAPVDRLFLFGGALLFFLAGSFQMWCWQQQVLHGQSPGTPITWYALALCIAGGFLGSMMAWQSPSPYQRSIVEYYHQAWMDRSTYPTLPVEPSNDLPL